MSCAQNPGQHPFSHQHGYALMKEGICIVQIPRNASEAVRKQLGGSGWNKVCIHTEKPSYTIAFLRDPIERHRSGWSEMMRRYSCQDAEIAEPFTRDDHTTPQSWFLRGIKINRGILLEEQEIGASIVSRETGKAFPILQRHHASDKKPGIPNNEILARLCDYLRDDIVLYHYWMARNRAER